jgi:hypothetical protein
MQILRGLAQNRWPHTRRLLQFTENTTLISLDTYLHYAMTWECNGAKEPPVDD